MTTLISNISFDAHDPYAQMRWWDQVLENFNESPGEDSPGDPEAGLEGPDGMAVLFLKVPEGKTVKNRLHLCLVSADGGRDDAVSRVIELGAKILDDRRTPDGKGWVVFADPEGNEFCVVRSREEIQADPA